jgi:hypothetical protein
VVSFPCSEIPRHELIFVLMSQSVLAHSAKSYGTAESSYSSFALPLPVVAHLPLAPQADEGCLTAWGS